MYKYIFKINFKALTMLFVLVFSAIYGNAQYKTILKYGDKLGIPETYRESDLIKSLNGKFLFSLSLSLYGENEIKWNTNIDKSNLNYLELDRKCNLVLYNKGGTIIWKSSSFNHGRDCSCELRLQDDGNLTIYDGELNWSLKNPTTGDYYSSTGHIIKAPSHYYKDPQGGRGGTLDW
jgi:hypothetical protein